MADQDKEIADRAAADAKAAVKARNEQLQEERRLSDAATKEQLARVAQSQPTPTQEENDRAKLGLQSLAELDDKEPDGSPEQRDLTAGGAAPYATRAAAPKK